MLAPGSNSSLRTRERPALASYCPSPPLPELTLYHSGSRGGDHSPRRELGDEFTHPFLFLHHHALCTGLPCALSRSCQKGPPGGRQQGPGSTGFVPPPMRPRQSTFCKTRFNEAPADRSPPTLPHSLYPVALPLLPSPCLPGLAHAPSEEQGSVEPPESLASGPLSSCTAPCQALVSIGDLQTTLRGTCSTPSSLDR